jgi:hypothetical protein
MNNSPSNFRWSKMRSISIERYQRQTFPMLHACVKSIQSLKTATDGSDIKDSDPYKTAKHDWHHSIDRRHIFFHVNFDVVLFVSFTRTSMSNKKWHSHGSFIPTTGVWNDLVTFSQTFDFLNNYTHSDCASRLEKQSIKVRFYWLIERVNLWLNYRCFMRRST